MATPVHSERSTDWRGAVTIRRSMSEIVIGLLVGLFAAVLGGVALGISPADLTSRWTSGATGDMALHYIVATSASHHTLLGPNEALGFPANQNLFFAPMFDFASAAVLSLEALFLRDGILILNVYQILGFGMTGFAGYFLFRALRVRPALAVLFGLVFALMPFHFQRVALGHAFVGNYWGVAIIGILLLMMGGPRINPLQPFLDRSRGRRSRALRILLPIAGLTFLLSLTNSYYFVFGALVFGGVLLFTAIALLVQRKSFRPLLVPAAVVGLLVVFVAAQLALLSLDFGDRYQNYFSERLPTESEQHSGKIASLLLPWNGTGFGALRDAAVWYQQSTIVSPSAEPTGTPLLAAIAMVLIVLFILVRLFLTLPVPTRRLERLFSDERLSLVSAMFLWCLLFFLVGGLGYIFAALVSPEIRSWVRLSVVLSTLALMFLAVVVDELIRTRLPLLLAIAGIAGIAVVDQLSGVRHVAPLLPTDDRELRAAVAEAEDEFADGCGIVQLPLKGFPESGPILALGDYEEALPYILSPDTPLRFSYGSVSGTKSADFWRESTTPVTFEEAVRESEACGVLVDQFAYGEDQSGWRAFVDQVGDASEPVVVSSDEDQRYLFFRVAG